MRYLVRARVKPGRSAALLKAIDNGTLGEGSVAEGEYLRNMREARVGADATAHWVEVCYCPTPLLEERPYWEQFFDLTRVPFIDVATARLISEATRTRPAASAARLVTRRRTAAARSST